LGAPGAAGGESAGAGQAKAGGGSRGSDLDPAVRSDQRTVTWVVGELGYDEFRTEPGGSHSSDDGFLVVWNEPTAASANKEGGDFLVEFGPPDDRLPGGRDAVAAARDFQWKAYGDGGISIRVHALDDGALVESGSVAVGGDPYGPPPVTSLSNDGEVLAFVVESYGDASSTVREPGRSRNLIPAAPPEVMERAGVDEKGLGGFGGPQSLADWARGEDRQLPFRLGEALWTPVDKYLVGDLDSSFDFDGLVPYFTPAANLTAQIRPRVLFGDAGVDLWILATDRYLDFYRLEYADLDAPELVYESIGLPSDEPLFGERWGTWLPPGNGRYRLRLSIRDRAGNEREASRRVVWNGDNDIANLYLEERYVSPFSSPGVKDQLIFHYTVLRPANLDFAIVDENGNVVAEIPVAADQVGPATTLFGGTDGAGNPLPDGRYALTF
ncbi:MAG: Ig-like domain repeat protein, partial [Holophagales bacterium]|nr:Ig-like domain repeat protein [Holophagales bacterium]